MIEVKNLVKQYGDHIAVDHLSFTVEPGQIYGFLGPNGAGKSTTMNIMTGYLGATSGEVLINGYDILEDPEEAKKCIGYLPELPPLYTDMTVEEYLRFVAELKKVPKAERKSQLERILNLCHLQDMRKRLIRNLSKGYKQRVGLAQAITGFPDIIILDEPTVGLDPKQIIEIRDLMRTLSKEHTVILSSHILSEVQEVCDTILIINQGKLVACDTPDNLESSLAGGNRLELTIKGEAETVRQILEQVEGINNTQLKEKAETVELILSSDLGVDLRETLFYAFAEARCPILMMKNTEVSLENVFLQLTAEQPEAATVEEQTGDEPPAEEAEPAEAPQEQPESEPEAKEDENE